MGLVKQKLVSIPAEIWAEIEAEAAGGSTSKVIIDWLRESAERRQKGKRK